MKTKQIQCPVRDEIKEYCSCPKSDCERHGLCCECIVNHKSKTDLPYEKRFPHCLRELFQEACDAKK